MKPVPSQLQDRVEHFRTTGVQGTSIRMHRSLDTIRLTPLALMSVVLLPLICDGLLWHYRHVLLQGWAQFFAFWQEKLGAGSVAFRDITFLGTALAMPYPASGFSIPPLPSVVLNALACAVLLAATRIMPARFTPLAYLLRAGLLIQLSASLYFWLRPHLPYDMPTYLTDMLSVGLALMLLISPILALIYYIFPITLWRKLLMTTLIVVYFYVALPFQALSHALLMHYGSVLFMPVLYMMFGLLLDTMMFVAWYSLAMTWTGGKR